jgi:hypothetical protein
VGELQELMRFVQECRKFRLRGAQHAMNSVFMLIWRKDHAINELVIQAAESLFMNNPNGEALAKRSIDNLMDVTMEASVEEWLSLEEALVCAVKKRKRLPIQMVDLLWDIVIADEAELEKKLAAVRLMGVFGRLARGGCFKRYRSAVGACSGRGRWCSGSSSGASHNYTPRANAMICE